MNGTKIFCVVALLPCMTAASHAAAQRDIDMNNLSESRIEMRDVTRPGSPGKSFIAATVIDAPIPRLCEIIQDFPGYPGFMPNTDQAKVTESTADYSMVDMTLKLPLGKIKKYRLKMEPKIAPLSCKLSWKLVPWKELKQEETIVDTAGYWQLTPSRSNTGKTIVKYVVFTDPGPVPLGLGWIVDSLSKDSIPKTLEALRSKAAQP